MGGNYTIIRVAKIKNTANLLQSALHNNREHKKTPNAKPELSHLNTVEFGVKNAKEVVEAVKGKLEALEKETGKKNRKDAVIVQEYLLNASPEFFQTLSPTDEKKWIQKNIEFMKDKYGEENLIQVVAHRDESHLHLQAMVVPIMRDDTGAKLSAKAYAGTKALLRQLQTDYAEAMKEFGLKRGRGYNIEMDYKELNEYKEETKQKLEMAKQEAEKVKYNYLNPGVTIKKLAEEKSLLQQENKEIEQHTKYLEKKLERLEKVIELVQEERITPKQIRDAQINEKTKGGKEYDAFIDKIIDQSERPKAPFPTRKPQYETFEDIIEKTESQEMRKFEQEIIDQIKKIPIQYYLKQTAGIENWEAKGTELYAKSPFRIEKTPSFALDERTNTWYDFGEEKGGDIIKLDMMLNKRDFVQAVRFLSGGMGIDFTPTPPEAEEQDFTIEDTQKIKIEIEEVKEIKNKPLLRLLEERSIKKEVAVREMKEIHYKAGIKRFYGIGMECDNGAFATFNRHGKYRTGEADITTIPLKGSKNTVIFEGMTDYLARLSEIHPRKLSANVIIMHGTGNADKAIKKIKELGAENVYLYKHNDESKAGEKVLTKMKKELGEAFKITDMSENYKDFNDYNEKVIWEAEQKQEQEMRRDRGLEM